MTEAELGFGSELQKQIESSSKELLFLHAKDYEEAPIPFNDKQPRFVIRSGLFE